MTTIEEKHIIKSLAHYRFKGVSVPESEGGAGKLFEELTGSVLDITLHGEAVGKRIAPQLYRAMADEGYFFYPLGKEGLGKTNRYLFLDAMEILQLCNPLEEIKSDLRTSKSFLRGEKVFCQAFETYTRQAEQWKLLGADQKPKTVLDVGGLHQLARELKEAVVALEQACRFHGEVHCTKTDAIVRHLEKFALTNEKEK